MGLAVFALRDHSARLAWRTGFLVIGGAVAGFLISLAALRGAPQSARATYATQEYELQTQHCGTPRTRSRHLRAVNYPQRDVGLQSCPGGCSRHRGLGFRELFPENSRLISAVLLFATTTTAARSYSRRLTRTDDTVKAPGREGFLARRSGRGTGFWTRCCA